MGIGQILEAAVGFPGWLLRLPGTDLMGFE